MLEGLCTYFFEFLTILNFAVWNFETLKFIICFWQLGNFIFWKVEHNFSQYRNFEILYVWNLLKFQSRRPSPRNDEYPRKQSSKPWIWFLHLSKTWDGNLVTFVFPSNGTPAPLNIPTPTPASDRGPTKKNSEWETQFSKLPNKLLI